MNTIERIEDEGYNFPLWKLQHQTTWQNIHRDVCPSCAKKIVAEQGLLAEPEDLAMDNIGRVDHSSAKNIVDYKRFIQINGKWKQVSVFDLAKFCSICQELIVKNNN